MLEFRSGSSNAVNAKSAVRECLDHAFGDGGGDDCSLLIIYSTVGHNFPQLIAAAREEHPKAHVVGGSGSGVIASEGVSETMRSMALMAITGDEISVASGSGLTGQTSEELGKSVAQELKAQSDDISMIYVLSAGLDVAGDKVINGIEAVFGSGMTIFGLTTADNGKAKRTFQFHDEKVMEDGLVLVGFSDPSLELVTGVHHGSVPLDAMTFEVTKSNANQVLELDGQPAWPALMAKLGLPADTPPADALPIAGLGVDLNDEESADYDNPQILRVPIKVSDDKQSFYLPTSVEVGTRYVLMQRDEQLIFEGVDRLMGRLRDRLAGRRPVAVFHADCMARGRLMFNRVLKDEIIAKMQYPLCGDEMVPWLGIYGFSEYARLAGKNQFHSYTTSLFPIVRNSVD